MKNTMTPFELGYWSEKLKQSAVEIDGRPVAEHIAKTLAKPAPKVHPIRPERKVGRGAE
jgi:hypothetical protein